MVRNLLSAVARSTAFAALVLTLAHAPAVWAANTTKAPRAQAPSISIDANGTVHVIPMSVPVSEFLSPQGQEYVRAHLHDVRKPELLVQHNGVPALLEGYIARERALYPLVRQDTKIAGVHAYVYTPKSGIAKANTDKVLIDLHGGGFLGCWPACGELESMPIAALGRIRVISVDYREYPANRFPAASEDVATVYRALLKTYRPENIGIYGCSAGGTLTGEAVAWFESHHLPMPGAIGILCAGLVVDRNGFGGDSNYTGFVLGEGRMPPIMHKAALAFPYFEGADLRSADVSPALHPDVLAKFPPTLVVTATRDFAMSSAVYTHNQLIRQHVDAELHVWNGLFHGFFYNPDVPELRQVFGTVVAFFNAKLGHRPKPAGH